MSPFFRQQLKKSPKIEMKVSEQSKLRLDFFKKNWCAKWASVPIITFRVTRRIQFIFFCRFSMVELRRYLMRWDSILIRRQSFLWINKYIGARLICSLYIPLQKMYINFILGGHLGGSLSGHSSQSQTSSWVGNSPHQDDTLSLFPSGQFLLCEHNHIKVYFILFGLH